MYMMLVMTGENSMGLKAATPEGQGNQRDPGLTIERKRGGHDQISN